MRLLAVGYVSIGVILGAIVATGIFVLLPVGAATLNLQMGPVGSELIAASGGALFGGTISALVAAYSLERTFRHQEKLRRAQASQTEKATLNTIFSKLLDSQGELLGFKAHFDDDGDEANMKFNQLSMLSKPLFPQMHFWRIEPDELAVLMSVRDVELYNGMLDWKRVSQNLEFMSHEYAKRMQEFEARLLSENAMVWSGGKISGVGGFSLVEHGYLYNLQADLYRTALTGIVSIEKSLKLLVAILRDRYGQSVRRNELCTDAIEQSLSGLSK